MHDRETNSLAAPAREWLDLRALTRYASVSERTLRNWIHAPADPLPAFQVGGKLLVRKSAFDQWVMAHPVAASERVDVIVNDVMRRMGG